MVDRAFVGSTQASVLQQDALGETAQAFSRGVRFYRVSATVASEHAHAPQGYGWPRAHSHGRVGQPRPWRRGPAEHILYLPTVILNEVALQEHESPLQASGADGPREVLQPTPPQPTLPQSPGSPSFSPSKLDLLQ